MPTIEKRGPNPNAVFYPLAAEGLLSQSYPRQALGSTGTQVTDGTVYFGSLYLPAGATVTNVHVTVTAAGSVSTLFKGGLHDDAGARLGISADVKASVATGTMTIPLTSAYTTTEAGLFYVSVIARGGTMPTLGRTTNIAALANAVSGFAKPWGTQASQTDIPDPATIVVTNGVAIWVGVS